MGMTIESEIEYLENFSIYSPYQEAVDKVIAYIEQFQADYENRLKADKVAMLTELKTEIEKMQCLYVDFAHYVNEYDVSNLIQQKINALKGGE